MTASNSAPKKVLVIGSTGHAGVKCVDWTSLKDVANIADFQVVVVNTCTLAAWIEALKAARESADEQRGKALEKLGSAVSNNVSLLKSKLVQVLRAGGIVYAIVSGYRELWRGGAYYSPIVSSHEWVPLPVGFRDEPGDTLKVRDQRFSRYFATVAHWEEVVDERYDVDPLKGITERDLEPKPLVRLVMTALATDWRGNAVGADLAYTLHRAATTPLARALARGRGAGEYEEEPYLLSGSLVLLPPPTEVSAEEGVRILLEDFCDVPGRAVPPEWVEGVSVPGDDARKAALAGAAKALEDAQRKHHEAVEAQAAADEFKRLLYEKGLPLQEVTRNTFEAMGIRTEESPVSDEFMLVWDDQKVLVEVTGTGKSIAGRDLSQLIKDQGNYLAKVGHDVKGALVGNAWVGLPPGQRDTRDKPIFPDDVQKTAQNHSIALVSTLELFKAYCTFLEGKVTPEQVFRRIADGSAVVTLIE